MLVRFISGGSAPSAMMLISRASLASAAGNSATLRRSRITAITVAAAQDLFQFRGDEEQRHAFAAKFGS